MAAPLAAAQAMAAALPPGPLLELCCGVGGITQALAAAHPVLAVDRDPIRLAHCWANLAAAGLAERVSLLCCDLTRPALCPAAGPPAFVAAVLDPDWSPKGAPSDQWTDRLDQMQPPAQELIHLAFAYAPLVVIRLPRTLASTPELASLGGRVQEWRQDGRRRFLWAWLAR
ncbi:MAG: class I SAM-dependent methyltransferase [Thermodesulfobacteriota bacterium]